MLPMHTYIYKVYVKPYYYIPALVFCTPDLLWIFQFKTIPVHTMKANRGSTILFHTFFTLALHRVTVHHQAPTTLTPSTHHLGSCEHSRANLEAFKRGRNFYQTTIPYMFSPQHKSPHWLCHCCTVEKP